MLGATELDFNNDGWPDLAVASDTQRDLLYVNNGNGTFKEIGAVSGMAYDENGRARAGMGIDAGVVDNSGKETIFVGNFSKEMIGVFRYQYGDFFEDRSATAPADAASSQLLKEQIEEVLHTLTDREHRVLQLRFGLADGRSRTLEEVGREFSVTRERIRQIEAKALRKLRHPSRSKKLRDFLE